MKLITELIEFALEHGMLTEEHKQKLQNDGFYTFHHEEEEYYSSYDYEYRGSLEDDFEDELDRKYNDKFYHPGKRHREKRSPDGPKLTVEELNQRVEEDWKKLTEEFPCLAPLWNSWKAGKLMRVLTDGFTLNDVYSLMNVERQDYSDFSGPAPAAYRQLLRQVGNAMGKYSWVIKRPETASMVEFTCFRQKILEEVRTLYETDREKFAVLSSQNGKLNFPFWEKTVKTDITSMKVWTILNLSSMALTPQRIEAILTWKPELAIAMQLDMDYITDMIPKLEQRDWSSLMVIIECEIENSILKSVGIPSGMKAIGVVIPKGVTVIGNDAFYGRRSLTSVIIPKGVMTIGDGAFRGCRSLVSVALPKGMTAIGNGAFSYCSSLTSVSIPDGVKGIGECAFYECSSLTSVVIPEGVTEIKNSAFSFCRSLISVVIPESVYRIGGNAFCCCSSLTSVVIPDGVREIGVSAFTRCSSLAFMTIPEGVWWIGSKAFRDCSSLTSIVIPENVKEIGNDTFCCCSSLTSVTIPKGVKRIGIGAFENCPLLTIHAPAGSYAEKYAKVNNIPFQPLEEEK